MLLKDIVKNIKCELLQGSFEIEISDIAYDSRRVKPGSLFVCREGMVSDGHQYIQNALNAGACAILVQKDLPRVEGITYIKYENARYALASMSAEFFGNAADKMDITGITGTKGKTTTAYMLKNIYKMAEIEVGLIGTIQNMIGEKSLYTQNTTPESYDLQLIFAKMLDSGIGTCVMEASSQGLYLERVACVEFDVGVFTNLSQDHIGPREHSSMEDYANQKAKLFKQCKKGLFNIDNKYAEHLMKDATCEKYTFGIEKKDDVLNKPDFFAKNINRIKGGTEFDFESSCGTGKVKTNMQGSFSVYNILAAMGAALLSGKVTLEQAIKGVEEIKVPGRAEPVETNGDYSILIDFAHNPESFVSILTLVREYAEGRIVLLFGCGGDKERPRELMGEIAGKYADYSIITSDNPRTEEPMSIMLDIEKGIKGTDGKYIMIEDRKEAIRYAILNAQPKDTIVLAGKGHETYQIFKDRTIHFDEREIVKEILEEIK